MVIQKVEYPRPGNPTINTITEIPVKNITPAKLIQKLALMDFERLSPLHPSVTLRLSQNHALITIHGRKRVVYEVHTVTMK